MSRVEHCCRLIMLESIICSFRLFESGIFANHPSPLYLYYTSSGEGKNRVSLLTSEAEQRHIKFKVNLQS